MSKICSSCNAENVDEAKFCRNCGSNTFILEEEKKKAVSFSENFKKDYENNSNIIQKEFDIKIGREIFKLLGRLVVLFGVPLSLIYIFN